jgi:hypothetical protein
MSVMKRTSGLVLLATLCLAACGGEGREEPPDGAATGVDIAKVMARGNNARALSQVRLFEVAVVRFFIDHDTYPETFEELIGHYLRAIPIDPWGEEYVYDSHGGSRKQYLILSKGEDRVEGTDDDISSEH